LEDMKLLLATRKRPVARATDIQVSAADCSARHSVY
jgi:hypothetical protein